MQIIIIMTFILLWSVSIVVCMFYMLFEGNGTLRLTPEKYPFFWIQKYHTFLKYFSKPYLILNFLLFIAISIYDIATQKEPYTESVSCWGVKHNGRNVIVVNKVGCTEGAEKSDNTVPVNCAFPYGGGDSLYDFFEKNKRNPKAEKGTVRVSFYVMKDGSLANFFISSSDNSALNKEAIRLIKAYPRGWEPAISYRKAVKQRVVLPIKF